MAIEGTRRKGANGVNTNRPKEPVATLSKQSLYYTILYVELIRIELGVQLVVVVSIRVMGNIFKR